MSYWSQIQEIFRKHRLCFADNFYRSKVIFRKPSSGPSLSSSRITGWDALQSL